MQSLAEELKPEAWTVSSNSALKISLVDKNGAAQFNPTFTYPIFGDSEQIFGYKDLEIHLAFDSVTFKPFVNVKYTKKLNDEVIDVQEKLLEFLPREDVIVKDEAKWIETFEIEQKDFNLSDVSSLLAAFSHEGHPFEVRKMKLDSEAAKRFHRRIQIFTLLFIESASYIDENDSNWEFYFTVNASTKQIIAFSTAYRFWKYLSAATFDAHEQYQFSSKVSQFLVFPPYQKNEHGTNLYNAIFDYWLGDESVVEINVEEPNEGFDLLRDKCDLRRVLCSELPNRIPHDLPLPEDWISATRSDLKLEKRQFMRLIEMLLLKNNSPNFRLQVKKRIWDRNFDVLMELDKSTRNDKIQTAFESVRDEYAAILSTVTKRNHDEVDFDENKSKKTKSN
ncbi:LAMI_0F12948g1_1 [Lachancea mirantina]|uniref:Histone acetyltransferase type B catalytic subunit n=1 Tax=Lachancea mirantina TaxID=1230905 RepID=A0A1G4K338_9SACH|nr:LAMI_0F12948g1_1 [Lachancea mirantina]